MSYVIAIEPAQFVTNQIPSWLIENLTSVNWGDRHEANRIAVWFLISLGLSTKTLWPGYYQFKDYKQFLRSGHWNLCLTNAHDTSGVLDGWSTAMGKRKRAVVTLAHGSLRPIDAAAYSNSHSLVHGKCHSKGITGKNGKEWMWTFI